MATDTVNRMLDELKARRAELRPMVQELERIESAISALEQVGGPPAATRRRGPGARRGAQRSTGARRGRPRKGESTRSDQFLALVEQQPGISISEAAEQLSIEPNYLYRVSATLQREGTIAKEGRGFVPSVAAPPAGEHAEVIELPSEEGSAGSETSSGAPEGSTPGGLTLGSS